jgi:hypothetical protein
VIRVGLIFPLRQSSIDMIEMNEKYENIKIGLGDFNSFDDSLAANSNFRKRLLDTVSTVTKLRQVRQNQRNELIKQIDEFDVLYPNRENVITRYRILDGLSNLLDAVFVCMAIPVIIYLFKRR